MKQLKETDKETWDALANGDFTIRRSGIPYTNLFVDEGLKQKIKEFKMITGITQNEEALERYLHF